MGGPRSVAFGASTGEACSVVLVTLTICRLLLPPALLFLSGITPTILGIIPYGAISFTTNEVTKRLVAPPLLPLLCSL
jgi:hypothetical protein